MTKPFTSAPTRPSIGWTPPAPRRVPISAAASQLLEDVYAYNDYSYRGRGPACEARASVTPDTRKGYLISEFGGQTLPGQAL